MAVAPLVAVTSRTLIGPVDVPLAAVLPVLPLPLAHAIRSPLGYQAGE